MLSFIFSLHYLLVLQSFGFARILPTGLSLNAKIRPDLIKNSFAVVQVDRNRLKVFSSQRTDRNPTQKILLPAT